MREVNKETIVTLALLIFGIWVVLAMGITAATVLGPRPQGRTSRSAHQVLAPGPSGRRRRRTGEGGGLGGRGVGSQDRHCGLPSTSVGNGRDHATDTSTRDVDSGGGVVAQWSLRPMAPNGGGAYLSTSGPQRARVVTWSLDAGSGTTHGGSR